MPPAGCRPVDAIVHGKTYGAARRTDASGSRIRCNRAVRRAFFSAGVHPAALWLRKSFRHNPKDVPMMRNAIAALALLALLDGSRAQAPADTAGATPMSSAAQAADDKDMPAMLRPAPDLRPVLRLRAVGAQIYECVKSDGGGWEWKFRAPEATLFDARGTKAGSHGAGPFWSLEDGSRIVGQMTASWKPSSADAIPWLLLKVSSRTGVGGLEGVEAVQRINTVGGVAPPAQLCPGLASDRTVRVPYGADYVFWSAVKPG